MTLIAVGMAVTGLKLNIVNSVSHHSTRLSVDDVLDAMTENGVSDESYRIGRLLESDDVQLKDVSYALTMDGFLTQLLYSTDVIDVDGKVRSMIDQLKRPRSLFHGSNLLDYSGCVRDDDVVKYIAGADIHVTLSTREDAIVGAEADRIVED